MSKHCTCISLVIPAQAGIQLERRLARYMTHVYFRKLDASLRWHDSPMGV